MSYGRVSYTKQSSTTSSIVRELRNFPLALVVLSYIFRLADALGLVEVYYGMLLSKGQWQREKKAVKWKDQERAKTVGKEYKVRL